MGIQKLIFGKAHGSRVKLNVRKGNEGTMLSYAFVTDQGMRETNEDSAGYAVSGERNLYLVADGLGGHGNGDFASRFVVDYIEAALDADDSLPVADYIEGAQSALLEEQKKRKAESSMKTTITCLELSGKEARMWHVGDSRIYWFHKGKYKARTKDHSVPQMLYMSGQIREKDIRHHEDRSRLLKVMGTEWNTPQYECSEKICLGKNESFLLCSDGFWELIEEREMQRLLKKAAGPQEWLASMKEVVMQNGRGTNMDNFTALAVFVRE